MMILRTQILHREEVVMKNLIDIIPERRGVVTVKIVRRRGSSINSARNIVIGNVGWRGLSELRRGLSEKELVLRFQSLVFVPRMKKRKIRRSNVPSV
jgi:hypothetical protein